MKHEEILKRPDGSSVKIEVTLNIDSRDVNWRLWVSTRNKGFKKWKDVVDTDDYFYRKIEFGKREAYCLEEFQKHVTAQEIYDAKKRLIDSIKF